MDFGTIRSLAQAAPSEDAWEALCAKLDEVSEPHEIERVLGYLEGALRRWPQHLRVIPKLWRREFMREGKAVMRVAEVAELQQPSGGVLVRLIEKGAPAFRHLKRLSIKSYMDDIMWVERFLATEDLSGLYAFGFNGLRDSRSRRGRFDGAAESWGRLGLVVQAHEALERFEIRGGKNVIRKDMEAFLKEPLGVKSLTIERSNLRPFHMGAIARQLPSGLKELDLGGNELHDAGWVELAAHDLSGLRTLRLDRTRGGDEGALALARSEMPDLEELSCLHVDMTEVGVGAWLSASFERLRVLELDLRGSTSELAGALSAATCLGNLERVKLRFSSRDDVGLCQAMAGSSVLQGVPEVHLSGARVMGLVALLGSEALAGVERLTLELVRMSDDVWDALAGNPHLSSLESLTILRSANADLATPGHMRFCKGEGLSGLRRLSFEECAWGPLRHLANKGRLGTLEELTVRRCEVGLVWLGKLFENPDLERVSRFTLEVDRALTDEEALVCVHPTHRPREWSPPYSAYKTLSRH